MTTSEPGPGDGELFCEACGEVVRSNWQSAGRFTWLGLRRCQKCGEPFALAERRSQTLREAIQLLADHRLKAELLAAIDDIIVETHKTEAAAHRFVAAILELGDCDERDELRKALAIAATDSVLGVFKVE